jgi:NAD(P)H dehydrogenase (quinone)
MKRNSHITVFGATGGIGGELLGLFSAAKIPVMAVTRNRNKVVELPHVTWVEADMNNIESLYPVMADSRYVFLASPVNEEAVTAQCNVIDAAVAQGVEHIVKISSAAANPDSPFFIAKVHGQIEVHLKAVGINATILRPTGFMQNWLNGLVYTVKAQRKIFDAAGEGKRAYIDMRDIAEVAFTVLQEPDKHTAHTYLLTSDEAVNYARIAELLTEAVGEPVHYIPVTAEVARQQLTAKGLPAWTVDSIVGYAEEQRKGLTEIVSTDVRDILQKPARTVAGFVNEYAPLFK